MSFLSMIKAQFWSNSPVNIGSDHDLEPWGTTQTIDGQEVCLRITSIIVWYVFVWHCFNVSGKNGTFMPRLSPKMSLSRIGQPHPT